MALTLTVAALGVALAGAPVQAPSGLPDLRPFGVSQDGRPEALGCQPIEEGRMGESGQYACKSLPEPNAMFQDYILAYVKGVGICNVVAVSPYRDEDDRAATVRGLFRQASQTMQDRLGRPDEQVDHAESIQAADDANFRSAIMSGERQIFVQWNDLRTHFRNMQSASLTISGDEQLGLAVYEVYRFAGNDECLHRLELATGMTTDE